jgi:hypothetical protein
MAEKVITGHVLAVTTGSLAQAGVLNQSGQPTILSLLVNQFNDLAFIGSIP